MRPAHSPLASVVTAPVATLTRYEAPRARPLAPNRIDCPSGAQGYCPMLPLKVPVSLRGSPPSAGMTHSFSSASSHDVSLGARYDSILPSGDHCTAISGALFLVSVFSSPLPASTTAISVWYWPLREFSRR